VVVVVVVVGPVVVLRRGAAPGRWRGGCGGRGPCWSLGRGEVGDDHLGGLLVDLGVLVGDHALDDLAPAGDRLWGDRVDVGQLVTLAAGVLVGGLALREVRGRRVR